MNNIEDIFEEVELAAHDAIKNILIKEIDLIRDTMAIVNMFLGEPLLAGVKYLQEIEQKNSK